MFRKIFLLLMLTIGGNLIAKNSQIVVLETTSGNIQIKLFSDIAPKACENFIKLAKKGYYNDTTFHRVIKDFMIQGGDPTGSSAGGESIWGKPFEDEVSEKVKFDRVGLLAMANSGPDTNGSQFFITTSETPWLNKHHTIFGEVIKGYENVEKINKVKTDSRDKPLVSQKIIKAYKLGD
jgi:peptidylprolyl isomerase